MGKYFLLVDLAEMQRAVEADDIQSLVKIAESSMEISYSMKQLSGTGLMSVDGPSLVQQLIW